MFIPFSTEKTKTTFVFHLANTKNEEDTKIVMVIIIFLFFSPSLFQNSFIKLYLFISIVSKIKAKILGF
jgi:hypothetical protein